MKIHKLTFTYWVPTNDASKAVLDDVDRHLGECDQYRFFGNEAYAKEWALEMAESQDEVDEINALPATETPAPSFARDRFIDELCDRLVDRFLKRPNELNGMSTWDWLMAQLSDETLMRIDQETR